ncbi:hypothetical protein RRG08_019263 [Elysia crispata]|uniref:Uncharacterized protein n=1 Tax=Elysia crispata TaxID=231223 RepID=A0AAE0YU01_9GAST|nr:hypothetical protein RRG08_019263 [Elysia crispata]
MSAEKERKKTLCDERGDTLCVETTGDERGERKKENTLWRPPVMSAEKERKHFVTITGDERGERKKTLCGDHR